MKMRKYGWVIGVGTLMAVALAVFLATYHTPIIEQLTFTEQVCGMDLKLFHDGKDDIYYLFIPAYVDKEHVSINMPDDVHVRLVANGQDCGTSLANLPLNEPVEFSIYPPYNKTESYTLELRQNKNLPTLFIETGSGGLDYVHLRKGNETQATIAVVDSDGSIEYSGITSLVGRGNATWGQPKVPYNVKFHSPVNLTCHTDTSRNFCLLANYGDDSQIRNAISYHIADMMGIPYTSHVEFASIYINGEYCGLYYVTSKQNYKSDVGTRIRALFERTASFRVYDRISDNGFYIRTRYGDADEISRAVNSFEYALYCDTTPYQQLCKYADMHKIAQKFVVDAVCANYDLKLSQYYLLNSEGKISPICAWDYDNTFGISPLYPDFAFNQIAISHPWYNALFEYKEFRQELLDILPQYSSLLQDATSVFTDSICRLIESDWVSNTIRWRNYVSPWKSNKFLKSKEYDFSTLQGHSIYIHDFMKRRLQFISEYWSAPEQFCQITFDNNMTRPMLNTIALYYPIGDTLTADKLSDGLLTMPDDGFVGWYTQDGTSVTDVGVVTQDMSFDERIAPKSHTTALLEKALHKAWLLILIAVFGCLSLWLFVKAVLIPIKEARG